jgi:hypothetical protein
LSFGDVGQAPQKKCSGAIDENREIERRLYTKRYGHRASEESEKRGAREGDRASKYAKNEGDLQQAFCGGGDDRYPWRESTGAKNYLP